jgi:hypothetical protein
MGNSVELSTANDVKNRFRPLVDCAKIATVQNGSVNIL